MTTLHTQEEFMGLISDFSKKKQDERLGQYLMNRMRVKVNDPELFYEESDTLSTGMYYDRYVVASNEEMSTWSKSCDNSGLPFVSPFSTAELIRKVSFHVVGHSTYCYLTIHGDHEFTVEGKSSTFPGRYNSLVGKSISYKNAFSKLMEFVAFHKAMEENKRLTSFSMKV